MATPNPNISRSPMYPAVDASYVNPTFRYSPSSSGGPTLYPTIDANDCADKLFPQNLHNISDFPSAPPESVEETVITVRGAIVNLIDKQYSVELATGDLSIHRLRQGDNTVAVIASIGEEVQWPLTKDLAAVKLDQSHYFFSFRSSEELDSDSSDEEVKKNKQKPQKSDNKEFDVMNYGLTIASKGQESLLKELDGILDYSCSFSVHKVENKAVEELGGNISKDVLPEDLKVDKKKEILEKKCAAYWTTLAPNVEEYSGTASKMIATGSGQLIKGILWCGDVAADRLKRGDEILKKKVSAGSKAEVSPQTLKRIRRVKRITKMTEKVATGVLSGVVKVSGFVTGSVVNSKLGKKFFSHLPGEMILASLDGFSRVCDAVEVAGKNVMSTSSTVTTGLVSQRYGEEAAKATNEGLDAAGHAIGTAWAVFQIKKALNPKSVMKPTTLVKSAAKAAAAEVKKKKKKKKRSSK